MDLWAHGLPLLPSRIALRLFPGPCSKNAMQWGDPKEEAKTPLQLCVYDTSDFHNDSYVVGDELTNYKDGWNNRRWGSSGLEAILGPREQS
jgi:hypothetical protein